MVNEFLNDTKNYNIFSYDDYKKSSLILKLKKIELLNEYYNLTIKKIKKLPVFIDFDGVILDTMREAKILLEKNHNLNLETSNRDNKIEQEIISNFFKTLDWNYLLNETKEINESIKFLKLIKESKIYNPTIYSAVNSFYEAKQKHNYIEDKVHNINHQFVMAHTPKICEDKNSILIDDDNFNLDNWKGYPIHFDSTIKSIYPNINDLGELYYLFYCYNNTFYIGNNLKNEYRKIKIKK